MALTEDNVVYAWGYNGEGCLGNGTTANSTVPIKMLNTGSVDSIGIGEKVSFVIRTDGSLYICYSISTGKDLVCRIYTLNSSGAYSLKFSNDDSSGIMGGNNRDFYSSKPLTAGTEYYIYIYPHNNQYDGAYELHIDRESNSMGYSFYTAANVSTDVYFNVNNLSTFTNRTFTVTYDPTKLALSDACIFTKAAETAAGSVKGTNITIVSVSDGELVFKISQSIPSGKKLTGTINVIRFTSLASGSKTVSFKVNDTSA